MKRHLLFTALLSVFTAFPALADNDGILTPVANIGDDFSLVAYCQDGEDYLVAESTQTHPYADTYNIYNSSLQQVYSITDYVKTVSFLNTANHAYQNEDESFYFSQTLLNDDAEFEYLVEKNKVIDNGGYAYTSTYGFKIMQTNGNCLADITYPDNSNIESPMFIKLKDKIYLSISYGSGTYTTQLYEVDRKGSSNVLKLVSEKEMTSGYPNPVKRGETYTIYREKCDMSDAVVNVLSTDGSLVGSFTTGDNKQATVDTSAMNSGLYLYNVVRKNKLIASGRFIIE